MVLDDDTTSEWSGDGGVGQWLKIKFAREYLINTIRVMQKSTATDQIKGLRLEFSDGSEAFVSNSSASQFLFYSVTHTFEAATVLQFH